MINAPKSKGAMQIRFSSKIFKDPTISGELVFPDLSRKDYEDFLKLMTKKLKDSES